MLHFLATLIKQTLTGVLCRLGLASHAAGWFDTEPARGNVLITAA
jgi:hypothetical protein